LAFLLDDLLKARGSKAIERGFLQKVAILDIPVAKRKAIREFLQCFLYRSLEWCRMIVGILPV